MKRYNFIAGAACLSLTALATCPAASAMNGPSTIQIDGGPIGPLQISGGVDGYGYVMSNPNLGNKSNGVQLGNSLITLQKTSGILQFTVEVGAYSTQTLGYAPMTAGSSTQNYFPESPLYAGYITIAPNSQFSVSLGQLSPLVGYEGSQDWSNANIFFTEVAFTQPAQGRGAEVAFTQGPLSATVSLTDGYYTGVVNYLQFLVTYAANSSNSISLYGGANLGETGVNVSGIGNPLLNNSTMFGAFYTYTIGNLSLTPEAQYQYTRPISKLGIDHEVSNLATALFGDYSFGASPWSLGGFIEYATQFYNKNATYTTSPDFFGFGPGSNLVGVSITPTWQYKDIFVRADAGFIHVNRGSGGLTFGTSGTQPNQFTGLLEAGLLF